jgi:RNA polymerase sigma-70 factor, ECF subfamily
MNSNEDDYTLVKKFLEGDESSFNRIVHKYQQKIYWHARRMTGGHYDADEVVQEVLMVIYNKLGAFKFQSALYTWIYRITSTRSLNYIRKKKVKSFFSLEDKEAALVKGDDMIIDMDNKEKLAVIEKYLQKLPAKQREIFIFRNFDELSYEEISKITGKSVGGLKANYFQAVKKMTEMVSKNDE